jgi:predicted kinase
MKALIGIGIPGSGKTRTLKKFAEKNNYTYICPDDIRAELSGGDASDQSKNKEVWELTYKRAVEALNSGISVVVDATFANAVQRKSFIQFLRNSGVEKIQGLYVDTPLEVAKERNQKRQRKVPDFVLDRMHFSIIENPPSISDGLDSLIMLDENQKLISTEIKDSKGIHLKKDFQSKVS